MCDELPKITSSLEAYDALVYALQKLLIKKAEKEALTSFDISDLDSNAINLYSFIDYLLWENFEGEILTLVVAGLYELYFKDLYDDYIVDVHPVNQSGASSKEVSDLDVYRGGVLYICNELKHKPFSDHDLRHAADKVISERKNQMYFIIGRGVFFDNISIKSCLDEYLDKGFLIHIVPIDFFVSTILGLIENIDADFYVKYVLQTAIDTKFKQETITFIRDATLEQFGV